MLGRIGAVINQISSNFTQQAPAQPTASQLFWQQFWNAVFKSNPNIAAHLRSKPFNYFVSILYDPRYSEVQKFEKIFGVKVSDIKKNLKQELLGDNVFDWISNLFSEKNLKKIEQGLRQGNQISNSIANALNVLRNSPSTQQSAQDLTTIRDTQSQLYFGAENFYQKYGPLMIIALVGVAGYALLKK